MIRKIVAVWVSLAMMFGLIVIVDVVTEFTPTVRAATLYVNTTGSGGAYTSVQDAINAAIDGDTVYVYNGTYYENVVVNKMINLTGESRDNTTIDGSGAGDTLKITVDWVNITGFTVMGGGSNLGDSGLKLESDFNSVFGNNVSSNKYFGIYLYYSLKNIITDNFMFNNSMYGLNAFNSNYNDVTLNMVTQNKVGGIVLTDSDRNNIVYNIALDTEFGLEIVYSNWNNVTDNIFISNAFDGIFIFSSSENYIANNNASSNKRYGIWPREATYNYINDNTIFSNGNYGIYMLDSSDNHINHNNIIDNTNQAYDNQAGNFWDDGYPSGGNYWSDYNGVDLYCTPAQDVPPPDGIGDSPYVIDADSRDNYPLMMPFIPLPLENYTILKRGWNLISIPLIQNDQNLTKVLEDIDGFYDAVQWYDITDPGKPWKHHKVGKPYRNDLFELNEKMGFWIHITQPGDSIFFYNGTRPTQNQTITLYSGWNLIGYPSLTSYNRTEGLNNLTFNNQVDAIWSYDASTQKWEEMGESDYFQIGRGYYIHAKSEFEWEVPL